MKFSELKYERPDFERLLKDSNALVEKIKEAKTSEEYFSSWEKFEALVSEFAQMSVLAYIRNTINTKDDFYQAEMDAYNDFNPRFEEVMSAARRVRLESKFRPEFEAKFGKVLTARDQLKVEIFKPEIIEDRVKEAKLVTEYQKLMAGAEVEFDGKKLNLSQLVPYQQSTDRAVRKAAFEKSTEWLSDNKEKLDSLYDQLVEVRDRIAKKLGFDSYLEVAYRSMERVDWNREDAKRYRDQIAKSVVPLTNKLYKEQADRIGVKEFKYYDVPLKFLTGNPLPVGDEPVLVEAASRMYNELSDETAEFFKQMVDKAMMDLTTKDGKAPGGYMTMLHGTKLPFIFSNFNGTSGDVDVLTHEAGHAFQGYVTRNEYPMENAEACSEIMETHSMSMEFFTHPWMHLFFGDDTEKYYYDHVVSALEFLPYGASIDEFQEYVYDNPKATPEERNAKYREIEKKYLPHIDYDGNEYLESGARWQRQLHVYHYPFYYLDYTIAQINAFQFFILDMEDHESAWKKYIDFCKIGGKLGTKGLIKETGLVLPFEDGSISALIPKLEKYLDSLDKSKIK